MDVELADGTTLHAATGGRPFDPARPVVVLVHGAGADHSFWRGQTRWLAHHGFAPLAIDLPGHGRSGGPPGSTIEDRGDVVVAGLDAIGAGTVFLVGHSMGSLVALDVAGRHPDRVGAMVLLATTPRMAVHPDLLSGARKADPRCLALARAWQHGSPVGGDPEPGTWRMGVNWRLTEATGLDVYASDLAACDAWEAAGERADAARCPALVVSGRFDRMTPARGGAAVAALLGCGHEVVDDGHMFPQTRPRETSALIAGFLGGIGR